ncbi:unnamed protein product [Clonostachys solani]|uniref:Zn(2)-C6 fungal-type domain-containing protein n=1 Tax=Clonostachys solani TaxID=160281 RepID=A0A9N9W8N2_9HYPO|nr:unnamed protein product [Clonostachys solani]
MEATLSPSPGRNRGPRVIVFSRSMEVATPRKRSRLPSDPSASSSNAAETPRTANRGNPKVSRACDFCKSRKTKCSGNQPCARCKARGKPCRYDSAYTRGRPPTPPRSASHPYPEGSPLAPPSEEELVVSQIDPPLRVSTAPSRASPELGMAEIEGQILDPTSSPTFLHRAWKKLLSQGTESWSDNAKRAAESQPLTMAGDSPLPEADEATRLQLPSPSESRMLLDLYFDVCIATYRFLHRPAVERWLVVVEHNIKEGLPVWHEIGRPRAAIVLVALAIAISHHEKSETIGGVDRTSSLGDVLFGVAGRLTENETGHPKLESAQARLVQVIYLLITSRFNRAWYVFGNTLQIISAIGLHRRGQSKRQHVSGDYIHSQYRMRTFWTAYILDNYLGVILGRPRHFHDDDIDQDYPDCVHDEDMGSSEPCEPPDEDEGDYHIEALIHHAKIAQMIGSISREVYTIKPIPHQERIDAAYRHVQRIHEWRASLPLHLGSVRPSTLIVSFRRQAIVLKLAYSHAIMHASRLFILGGTDSNPIQQPYVEGCIAAAKTVLKCVDQLAKDGPIFHAFWWTHYVTFCSLLVVYVFEIQQRRLGRPIRGATDPRTNLLELAEKCQQHLALATASNSPSRRYAVILEEFRSAATSQQTRLEIDPALHNPIETVECGTVDGQLGAQPTHLEVVGPVGETPMLDFDLLDSWQTTDWLQLDSSAFWPHPDYDDVSNGWSDLAGWSL